MRNFILLLVASLAFSVAFAESETMKGAAKDYDNFKKEMSAKLAGVEKQLDELRAKARTKGNEARESSIKELEETRVQLKTEVDSLNSKAKSNWKSMKEKLSASIESLSTKAKKALED